MSPFFSIVIPTYNRSAMIAGTVDSVLKQTFRSFEIIVVDDGSSDDTQDVLKNHFGGNEQVKIIYQENKERGAARNNGYKAALGKYVIFLDSDDTMEPEHLETLKKYIDKLSPEFIATKFSIVNEDGKKVRSDILDLKEGFYDYKLFLYGNPLACNVCVKKRDDLFLFVEEPKYAIKEDWIFLMQNLRHHKLYLIDKCTVRLLDHPGRSLRSSSDIIIPKTLLALKWIEENIALSPQELSLLKAHVSYFCGIHSYIDDKRSDAIRFTLDAIKKAGLRKKYGSLLLKAVVGRKFLQHFKRSI